MVGGGVIYAFFQSDIFLHQLFPPFMETLYQTGQHDIADLQLSGYSGLTTELPVVESNFIANLLSFLWFFWLSVVSQ